MENPKTYPYLSTEIYKTSKNSKYQSNSPKIYAYMAHMSSNVEIPRKYFGDILQLTN